MALQKTVDTNIGSVVDTYHKVVAANIEINKDGTASVDIKVATFLTAAASAAGKDSVQIKRFKTDFDVDDTAPALEQVYDYLNTLPEYAGAVNV
jgi:hypothetical protein